MEVYRSDLPMAKTRRITEEEDTEIIQSLVSSFLVESPGRCYEC
jgi:hypothetical protein